MTITVFWQVPYHPLEGGKTLSWIEKKKEKKKQQPCSRHRNTYCKDLEIFYNFAHKLQLRAEVLSMYKVSVVQSPLMTNPLQKLILWFQIGLINVPIFNLSTAKLNWIQIIVDPLVPAQSSKFALVVQSIKEDGHELLPPVCSIWHSHSDQTLTQLKSSSFFRIVIFPTAWLDWLTEKWTVREQGSFALFCPKDSHSYVLHKDLNHPLQKRKFQTMSVRPATSCRW